MKLLNQFKLSHYWIDLLEPELWAALMVIGFMATLMGPAWLGNIAVWLVLVPLIVVIVAILFAAFAGVIGRLFRS